MFKKAFLLMLALLMAVATLISPLAGATTSQVASGCVRIHYLRTDFNYDGWTLYTWGGGYNGTVVTWDSSLVATGMDEYGLYWDVPYGSGTLNFIVHKDSVKQYTADRSFPDPATGEEVWVIQDNGNYYTTVATVLAATGVTVVTAIPVGYTRIYYFRSDKTYSGWGFYGWTSSGDLPGVSWGTPLPIAGYDTYGYPYWDVPSNIAGYIIHKGDIKDTQANRSLDGSNNENYVVSGDPVNYTDRLTAIQRAGNRIIRAILIGLNTIQFTTLTAIDQNAAISVMDGINTVLISNIDRSQAPVYIITLAHNLDIKLYRLAVGNMSADVTAAPALLDKYCAYDGKLGVVYSAAVTTFKLWAPLADGVKLLLFSSNSASDPSCTVAMSKGGQGVWSCTVFGNLEGQLYQYQVDHGGITRRVLDPYAVSMAAFDSGGANTVGKAVVIDLNKTNPDHWKQDHYVKLSNPEAAIIYEAHVRDFTIADTTIPKAERGTYTGFIRKIPYLKALGVTHVQLQPIQNWYYGNESDKSYESGMATDNSNYNWGYDPHNYFTPEGWFASEPGDPYARIRELKHLISELHKAGIGVVLDVVYNHTAITNIFEDIVPYYYYRRNEDGTFTSGSGCGNDTASERAMFQKLMIDSTVYWVREYHVDGFRFDLMGLHDITTMKRLASACRQVNSYVELHGEGWNMGTLPLHDRYIKGGGSDSDYHRALLEVSHGVAAFSDGMRDGLIQQNYQTSAKGGFVQHDTSYGRNNEAYVRRGIAGNIVDYSTSLPINDAKYDCFCDEPDESVNYTTCHDGLTINDKLKLTLPSASRTEFIKRYKLQCAIIMTSQGKAFFQAGEELFRSKPATDPSANQNYIYNGYCHNSHDASDDINKIDWTGYQEGNPETLDLHDFYAGMIALHKAHSAFHMETAAMIQKNLVFIDEDIDGLIAYRIKRTDGKERWKDIIVIFNSTSALQTVNVPGVDLTSWQVVVDGDRVDLNGITTRSITLGKGTVIVPPVSAVMIHAPVAEDGDATHPTVNVDR
jgi:pullulanase